MNYRRCGRSGILLPEISLGLWHNFGETSTVEESYALLAKAFDLGITHFDLANNYGPPPGAAEARLGELMEKGFRTHRDEVVISTKAGHLMWDGPYGDWGSRKHLLASLDQSLRRMKLDYVDIFYSHRPDPETPLEETIGALVTAVQSGRALYAGISKYPPELARRACALLKDAGVPCLIHQFRYNMMELSPEEGLLDTLKEEGVGGIAFSPLAQGVLTGKYLAGVPGSSRAASGSVFLTEDRLEPTRQKVAALDAFAREHGRELTQLALRWVLRKQEVTSALIGARTVEQLADCAACLDSPALTEAECRALDVLLRE